MAKVVNLISDYPRQELAAHLLAVISFIQEKRKKKGFLSRKEEVIDAIRLGYIPLKGVSRDNLSLIVDGLRSLEPSFILEDVSLWESAIRSIRTLDHRTFVSKASAFASFRSSARNVVLRGILPSYFFPLLNDTSEVEIEPPTSSCDPLSSRELKEIVSVLDEIERSAIRFRELASEVRLAGEDIVRDIDSRIEMYPPDSTMRKEYRRERDHVVSSYTSLASRLERAATQYEELLQTLTSAPPVKSILMPVYLVETKGKERRHFLITNLRFKRPGLTQKIKDFFGRFDSLFDETIISKRLSLILKVECIPWGPNLLTEDVKDLIYGELASLEEEGYVDEDYIEAIAELISKSLF